MESQIREMKSFAEKLTERRKYSFRSDQWGQGLIGNAVLAGLLGEQAFANFINKRLPGLGVSPNTELLAYGDGGRDFVIFGQRIQVKNRPRGGRDLLIRREKPTTNGSLGKLLRFDADIYVKVSCPARGTDDYTQATIDGWCRDRRLMHGRFISARAGNHMNIEIPDNQLLCASGLVRHLKILRWEAEQC